jgi:hypothetical protein
MLKWKMEVVVGDGEGWTWRFVQELWRWLGWMVEMTVHAVMV